MFHNAVVEIGKTTSFGQELMDVGRKEGMEQGLAKGLERGLVKGRRKGLAEGLEQGLEQGLKQGLEQGLSGLVAGIRSYLEVSYPRLSGHRSIGRIATLEQANEILVRLVRAKSEAAAREILREI